MKKWLLLIPIAAAVFLITPYAFWDDGAPAPDFTAAELRKAVEGTWAATVTDAKGTRTLTLAIEQSGAPVRKDLDRSLIRSADACSSRTFIKSASACVDTTTMPLDVVVLEDGTRLAGQVMVVGFDLSRDRIMLYVGGIEADLRPDGTVIQALAIDAKQVSIERIDTRVRRR